MAFESTNAILGVKSLEEQKKSNRWSKWMDIANLLQNTAGMGADIWKTISGRKHDLGLASVTEGYREKSYLPGGYMYEYGKDSAGWGADAQAEADKKFQTWLYSDDPEAKDVRDGLAQGKMDEATAMERWFLTPDGQRYWAMESARRKSEIEAGAGRTASEARVARMREAIDAGLKSAATTRPDLFIADPRDPTGETLIPNPDKKGELRELLMASVGVEQPSQAEIDAVTPYLDSLMAGEMPEGGPAGSPAARSTALSKGQPGLDKELKEIKDSYLKIWDMNNKFKAAQDNPAQAQKILGDVHADMYKLLNELDDITGLDPEDLAAINAEKSTPAIQSKLRGESTNDYNQRVAREYIDRLSRRKELVDTILKRYGLLAELYSPSGP